MSKGPPKGIRYLNLGPWPGYLGFTTSEKAFNKEMKRLGIQGAPSFLAHENAHATTHFFVNPIAVIITIVPYDAKERTREAYAGLVAHEAMHVIQEMQAQLASGKSLGHEAEAYLMQQIVQECLQDAWGSPLVRQIEPDRA